MPAAGEVHREDTWLVSLLQVRSQGRHLATLPAAGEIHREDTWLLNLLQVRYTGKTLGY